MADDRVTDQRQRVIISWKDDETQEIEFDAVLTESHRSAAEITDHPVENGVDLTDHIRRTAEELRLTGVVTDDPLVKDRSTEATAASTGGDPGQRAGSAYNFLIQTKDQTKLVNVVTKLRNYRNMVIQTLNVTRDAQTSRILQAEIGLREILIAVTEQVTAPEPAITAAPKRQRVRKRGKRTKKAEGEANKTKARRSSAKKILNSFGRGNIGVFNPVGL